MHTSRKGSVPTKTLILQYLSLILIRKQCFDERKRAGVSATNEIQGMEILTAATAARNACSGGSLDDNRRVGACE